jgi:hypothetical protein
LRLERTSRNATSRKSVRGDDQLKLSQKVDIHWLKKSIPL